jgi:hypothetical protein
MRHVLALALIAVALGLPAGWALAAPDDATGPPCANISNTDWGYSSDGATATVTIFLDTTSCTGISHTLFVQDSVSETVIEATSIPVFGDGEADNTSGPGTDSVTVTATVPLSAQDGEVCLFATTSKGGRNTFDRAPDATLSPNCVELTPGGTGGGGGWR